jgi:hypothetical protein
MLMRVFASVRDGVRWCLLGCGVAAVAGFLFCFAAVPSFQAGVIRMIRVDTAVAAIRTTRAATAAVAATISVAPTLPRRRATTTLLRVTATVLAPRPRRECRSLTATTIDRPEEDTAPAEAEAEEEQEGAARRANDRDPESDALKRASISCLALHSAFVTPLTMRQHAYVVRQDP